jgi:hypothetical protein
VRTFVATFNAYWPNSIKPHESELVKTWTSVAQIYDPQVAMAALRDIFEGQEKRFAPTPASFKGVARGMQDYITGESRRLLERQQGRVQTFTGKEIAADDAFWEGIYDRADDAKHLETLHHVRETLQAGKPIWAGIGRVAS